MERRELLKCPWLPSDKLYQKDCDDSTNVESKAYACCAATQGKKVFQYPLIAEKCATGLPTFVGGALLAVVEMLTPAWSEAWSSPVSRRAATSSLRAECEPTQNTSLPRVEWSCHRLVTFPSLHTHPFLVSITPLHESLSNHRYGRHQNQPPDGTFGRLMPN